MVNQHKPMLPAWGKKEFWKKKKRKKKRPVVFKENNSHPSSVPL